MNTVNMSTGDTRVLRNRVKLEGGVFAGVLETDRSVEGQEKEMNVVKLEGGVFEGFLVTKREVPTGHVVTIAVQRFRDGNGEQRIQRSSYVVCGGVGAVL